MTGPAVNQTGNLPEFRLNTRLCHRLRNRSRCNNQRSLISRRNSSRLLSSRQLLNSRQVSPPLHRRHIIRLHRSQSRSDLSLNCNRVQSQHRFVSKVRRKTTL